MSKSVSFLTYDWAITPKFKEPNGCAWYRCELPRRELESFGWQANIGTPQYMDEYGFGSVDLNKNMILGHDIVVFKLIMVKKVLEILKDKDRKKKQKVVVDIDDFYEGLTEHNLAWKNTDPSTHEDVNREHYLNIIEEADYLTVSTQFLYDYYTKEKGKKNVFLIRNGIDIDRWTRRRDHARYLPTVGWVGATPWRSLDLEQLNPFLADYLDKNKLAFHHSGHIKESPLVPKLGLHPTTKFTHEPRQPISIYPSLFRKIDIGIVPLNNIPFNHAKSTIKGLEYAASGVPFIASYSPEYELLASQGVGRVAKTPEEWISHLDDLLDPKVRKEEADKNYENLKASHTMKQRGVEWNNVMQEIFESS